MKLNYHQNDFIVQMKTIKNLSEKTLLAYDSDLNSYFNYLSRNKIKQITRQEIIKYFQYLQNVCNLKDSTISRKIVTLKMYHNYLEDNYGVHNPFYKLYFRFKKEKRLPKTLSIKEITSLLKYAQMVEQNAKSKYEQFESIRNLALIDLLISTGIRIGEASLIKLEDIDLIDKSILIHGKGNKQRMIYISSNKTWSNIIKWIKYRSKCSVNNNYLFINKFNNKLSINAIDDIYRKYRVKCNINPSSTPHFLRHTFATNLLLNGADIRSVQELLGHSSISTTEIYTEISNNRKKEVLMKYNLRNSL